MSEAIPYHGNLKWLPERTILLVTHGSHAYGMATPTSDLDIKGVAIPPRAYFTGFLQSFEQAEVRDPVDMVIYDVRKFFKLAADCNPNIIEVLFVDEADVRHITPLGAQLREARHRFLSRKARHTFSGYAMAQLKRIETHRRWLLEPPAAPPVRAAFGLQEAPEIPEDQLQTALAIVQKQLDRWEVDVQEEDGDRAARLGLLERWAALLAEQQLGLDARWRAAGNLLGFETNFLDYLDRERRFRAERASFEGYQTWQRRRNPARAALEAQAGYDTKHAAHLVRLLRMCREILVEGEVRVRRPDAAELLAIRGGAWPYEALLAWAQEQDDDLGALAASSPLPKAPDRVALDGLCQALVEASL